MQLQPVNMRFGYGDAFKASRYTGYEVMIYACSHGDATLFSRGDLVEAAWRVAQPLMDYWAATPAEFPNYARNSWGPKAAADLIERDGRRWHEVVTEEVMRKVPLFKDGDMVFLEQVIMALRPKQVAAGRAHRQEGRHRARALPRRARRGRGRSTTRATSSRSSRTATSSARSAS